jgi:hypothetical protein
MQVKMFSPRCFCIPILITFLCIKTVLVDLFWIQNSLLDLITSSGSCLLPFLAGPRVHSIAEKSELERGSIHTSAIVYISWWVDVAVFMRKNVPCYYISYCSMYINVKNCNLTVHILWALWSSGKVQVHDPQPKYTCMIILKSSAYSYTIPWCGCGHRQ